MRPGTWCKGGGDASVASPAHAIGPMSAEEAILRRVLALHPLAPTAGARSFVEETARWQKQQAKGGIHGGEMAMVSSAFAALLGTACSGGSGCDPDVIAAIATGPGNYWDAPLLEQQPFGTVNFQFSPDGSGLAVYAEQA